MAYRIGALAALFTALMGGAVVAGQILVADEGGGTLSRIDPNNSAARVVEIGIAPLMWT